MTNLRRAAPLLQALAGRRYVVVCGSGGVGKTTTAAALGLKAAFAGRRVLVCTVDPARRLSTSLGLRQLAEKPRRLEPERLGAAPPREMWAMMLDTKRTFDALVERYTPDEAARQRILGNRFYQQISNALAGSHEYMAMEKLLELARDERFDLVVLDTPPTRHALDFLEAPDRLMGFLDASILRWFLRPYFVAGRLTLRVVGRTGSLLLELVDRVLGLQFLQDLSEFFLAFESMYDGFKLRATQVYELLRSPQAAFVVVASPRSASLDEAHHFHARLSEKQMPFAAFLVNRVHTDPSAAGRAARAAGEAPPPVDEDLAARLVEVHARQRALARQDRLSIARLKGRTREQVVAIPELEGDVHDLRSLAELAEALFGQPLTAAPRLARRA